MSYVDGFVVPVKRDRVAEYKKISRRYGKVCRELGATAFVECMADDVKPGKTTSFPQAVKLKEDEVVFFSWIVYPDKRTRDRVNKQMMEDPRLKDMMDMSKMPFDGKRMFFGGFKPVVEL